MVATFCSNAPFLTACVVVAALCISPAGAQDSVEDVPTLAPFGFKALEIFKVDGNSLGLRAGDMNNDGLLDLVVANNDEGTIRLLLQRSGKDGNDAADARGAERETTNEVESDPRFLVEKFYTEKLVTSLDIGDFNGDGRQDLAYYSDPPELEVVFQDGSWGSRREKLPIRDGARSVHALSAVDINKDGRLDLALLGKSKTYLIHQREDGQLAQPVVLYQSAQDAAALHVADLNGDGRPDLLSIVPTREDSVVVRLQGAHGFGPEVGHELNPIRAWDVSRVALQPGTSSAASLITVQRSNNRLKLFGWNETPTAAGLAAAHLLALRSVSGDGKRLRLIVDVNRDGRLDLLVSYPDTAQVEAHFQDEEGNLSRTTAYPTLAGVNGLTAADVDADGEAEIVFTSGKEKALGVSRWRNGRLQIPETVPLSAEPVVLAAGPLSTKPVSDAGKPEAPSISAGNGGPPTQGHRAGGARVPAALFLVSKAEPRGYQLSVATLKGEGLQVVAQQKLPLEGSPPSALRLFDADGDGATDILLTVPYEDAYLYRQIRVEGEKGKEPASERIQFHDISRKPGFGLGQIAKLEPKALTVSSLETDHSRGLLVASEKFVRLLVLDPGGRLKVLAQFSGRTEGSRLAAALLVNLDDDPAREVVMLDAASSSLEILQRQNDGTYAFSDLVEVPKFDLIGLEAWDMNADGREDVVILGKEKIGILCRADRQRGFQELMTYSVEQDKKLGKPHDLCLGDLNGDGVRDVVLSTAPRYNLLFLAPTPGEEGDQEKRTAKLVQRLAFPVFEEKTYMRRTTNLGPRQMLTADVDGDGLDDLLLLIHDRILLYLQDGKIAP